MTAELSLRFGGELAPNNRISLRTLGKAAGHLQTAIDRAALFELRKGLVKNAKIRSEEYEIADFYFEAAPPESFKFFARPSKPWQEGYLARLLQVFREADQKSTEHFSEDVARRLTRIKLRDQAETRLTHMHASPKSVVSFSEFSNKIENERAFVDKAIIGQINYLLAPLRSDVAGDSFIEISIKANGEEYKSKLSPADAHRIYRYTTERALVKPVRYSGLITDLHRTLQTNGTTAAFFNIESKKKSRLIFPSREKFKTVIESIGEDEPITFIGCPIFEYGSYDPAAGDVYFLEIVEG